VLRDLRGPTVKNFNLITGKHDFILAAELLKWFPVKLDFCTYQLLAFYHRYTELSNIHYSSEKNETYYQHFSNKK
jgi:hypothetical protein